jgi:hypothetical protein
MSAKKICLSNHIEGEDEGSMCIPKTGQDDSDQMPIPNYYPYEPEATQLTLLIQKGINEKENKMRLAKLLYPLVREKASLAMRGRYKTEDIEDAIQSFMLKHILSAERDGWHGKNNHHYHYYIYSFNPEYKSEWIDANGGNCFCGYIMAALTRQCVDWCRKMPMTTEMLPDDVPETNPATEHETEQREIAIRQIVNALGLIYKDFFDKVNSLDEYSTSARAVHERGIMVYHMIYAIDKLSSKKIDKNNICDIFYDEYLKTRPASFRSLAQKKWASSLEEIIAFQEKDYQFVLLSKLPFLSRLTDRVNRKGIADERFLSSEADINNKAHGWAKTIERRVKADYDAFVASCEKKREEIIDGLYC